MRVLVIDDSSFMRRVLSRLIEKDPDLEVVGTAGNGRDGLAAIDEHHPDVVTLDVQMPGMGGIDMLRELSKRPRHARPAVLMCSSLTAEGAHVTLEAMEIGAADFITKDAVKAGGSDSGFTAELTSKIKSVGRAVRRRRPQAQTRAASVAPPAPVGPPRAAPEGPIREPAILLIGASTGGPPVVERVIKAMPEVFRFPVVIAQHMPAAFTKSLAERLNRLCPPEVQLATDGDRAEPGRVYIGEGGKHVQVRKAGAGFRLEVGNEPADHHYRPSVDALLGSAAAAGQSRTLAMVMTGMGADGAVGAEAIANAGGTVLTQSEESCVVYGMPRAVDERGASAGSLDPAGLADVASACADGGWAARKRGGSSGPEAGGVQRRSA